VTTVDELLELYDRWGGERYDEDVAQLEHALQTAALAAAAGAADALIGAALLHDVGHLLELRRPGGEGDGRGGGNGPGGPSGGDPGGGPVEPHEQTGPAFLAATFPATVTGPIALHVAAKRYLCATEPTYTAGLSAGSRRSLRRQGGPMSAAEVSTFEAVPGWADAVALRRWDDAGKAEGAAMPRLDAYEPLLRSLTCSGS